eukprot:Polyplicarium_translucidae@DN2896_c0_g1_i6.p1
MDIRIFFITATVVASAASARPRITEAHVLLSAKKPTATEATGNETLWDIDRRLTLLPQPHPWGLAVLPSLAPYDYYATMVADISGHRLMRLPSQHYFQQGQPPKPVSLRCGAFNTGGGDRVIFGETIFGVADGVGQSTADPGPFADAILQQFAGSGRLWGRGSPGHRILDMDQLSRWAHEALRVATLGFYTDKTSRGSTAVLGRVDGRNNLGVFNLGDSGFRVMRRDPSDRYRRSTVVQSVPAQHSSGAPCQYGNDYPSKFVASGQKPPHLYSVPLRPGDLIIAATDGLLDNLYDGEVSSIAARSVSPLESLFFSVQSQSLARTGKSLPWDLPTFGPPGDATRYTTPPQDIAQHLVTMARIESSQCREWGPWDMLNRPEYTYTEEDGTRSLSYAMCGKPDDTAVVACWVE